MKKSSAAVIRAGAAYAPRRLAPIAACLAALLGGCAVDRAATLTKDPAPDYWSNHPIVLSEAPTNLNVFPGPGRMDRLTEARLHEFVDSYRSDGVSRMEVLAPEGASNEASIRSALPEVERTLARLGAGPNVVVGSYPAPNPRDAAPIRLSYHSLKSHVANRCGEWPTDIASASSLEGWANRPYWNYGCSYQNMMAQQVADPRDFVAPRAETPVDMTMRLRAIQSVRTGSDPATNWSVSVGGLSN